MRSRFAWALLLALILLPLSASAQFWEKKEWTQWSKSDAQKMLEDSPWARTWVFGENRRSEVGESSQGTARETEPRISYSIQLRSALPVRMAEARQLQIANKYDKMPEDKKKALDASIKDYLNRVYADSIVVHVAFSSNVQSYERWLVQVWSGVPSGTIPVNTRLITSSGKFVEPVRFIAPTGGAQEFLIIFPRLINGEPIFTSADKTFRIEFPSPDPGFGANTNQGIDLLLASGGAGGRVSAEFKLEKMTFKGDLLY
ncbi:MAG TPA: hypothetical protein VNL38_01895 [Candidatus Nitrosotenuis sp.]|nr:hypothetical protein [Candidatus Nitrosotenuis sp.]